MPKLSNLEDPDPLSPTQQGMIFDSLSGSGSEIYFEQVHTRQASSHLPPTETGASRGKDLDRVQRQTAG